MTHREPLYNDHGLEVEEQGGGRAFKHTFEDLTPYLVRDEVKTLHESLGLWLNRASNEYERRRADPLYVAAE